MWPATHDFLFALSLPPSKMSLEELTRLESLYNEVKEFFYYRYGDLYELLQEREQELHDYELDISYEYPNPEDRSSYPHIERNLERLQLNVDDIEYRIGIVEHKLESDLREIVAKIDRVRHAVLLKAVLTEILNKKNQ